MNAILPKKQLNRVRKTLTSIIRFSLLAALAYQLLYPLLYMLSMALRRPEEAMDPSVIWVPKTLTLSNFTDALRVMDFWDALQNSLIIGIGCGILDVLSCAFVAYGFARFKLRFSGMLFTLVILTLVVPVQTIILPLYADMKYFDAFGIMKLTSLVTGGPDSISLVGSFWAFFLPSMFGMGLRSGLYIFIFRQFFKGMPNELEDAAYMDGCGPFKTFFTVMLPNAKNAIITVFLFSFVWHWNEFYMSNLLLGNLKKNFAIALSSLRVDLQSVVNVQTISDPLVVVTRIQAGALLTILPLFILYLVTQRYFTDSIEHGAIK
ncbi:multiple sugar transport system permease protein [Paenibacillus castaneae]|uniref:carbohydrate ABC transporter permease n=1 Tax=Paenibacillus castaneae TaxID=474957 RepID=UPI000C9B283C|nr:carbohydrate ABC transporter permease [Paenibacillus castaneae]NIK75000.1 multiple sugar transport system permease protein [Paenibacillus castaneae]